MDYRRRPAGADKRAKQGGTNRYPGKAVEARDDSTEKPPRVRRAPLAVG